MKSKLLVLALSLFAISFVTANDTVNEVAAIEDIIEIDADEEEVADASEEVTKAKKAEVAFQDEKSCSFSR